MPYRRRTAATLIPSRCGVNRISSQRSFILITPIQERVSEMSRTQTVSDMSGPHTSNLSWIVYFSKSVSAPVFSERRHHDVFSRKFSERYGGNRRSLEARCFWGNFRFLIEPASCRVFKRALFSSISDLSEWALVGIFLRGLVGEVSVARLEPVISPVSTAPLLNSFLLRVVTGFQSAHCPPPTAGPE